MKVNNCKKPYDGKKSAWVPDKANGGYLEGLTEQEMKVADWEAVGQKIAVNVNGEVKTFKSQEICQINPPKVREPQNCNYQILITSFAV